MYCYFRRHQLKGLIDKPKSLILSQNEIQALLIAESKSMQQKVIRMKPKQKRLRAIIGDEDPTFSQVGIKHTETEKARNAIFHRTTLEK